MNFNFVPSLKHLTLSRIAIILWRTDISVARIVVSLWNGGHSKSAILHYLSTSKMEDKIFEKVDKLPLPSLLKSNILDFIKPVGFQLCSWMSSLCEICSSYTPLQSEISWTPQGTVDRKKTAEMLVRNEKLLISDRFKLACTYCLEDCIHSLWNHREMRKERVDSKWSVKDRLGCWSIRRRNICRKNLKYEKKYQTPIMKVWSHYLKGKLGLLSVEMIQYCREYHVTPFRFAFEYAAHTGNKAAASFFLKKLSSQERENTLRRTVGRIFIIAHHYLSQEEVECTEVLFHLLSTMDEKQQTEVFNVFSYEILLFLSPWPWQEVFNATLQHFWTVLSYEAYCKLVMDLICDRIIKNDGIGSGNKISTQAIFEQLWYQSPNDYKKYIISNCMLKMELLPRILMHTSKENLKLILLHATTEEKERIIFSQIGVLMLKRLMKNDMWDRFKLIIQECLLSKDAASKLKNVVKTIYDQFGNNCKYDYLKLIDEVAENLTDKSKNQA